MVNSLKRVSVLHLPIDKIQLVKNENLRRRNPNSNYYRIVVNVNNARRVNLNNKNLSRNQMREITSRLSRANRANRMFYLRNRVHNVNSLEKFINTFRLAYPVNNGEGAPLSYVVGQLRFMRNRNMRTYQPYINLQARMNQFTDRRERRNAVNAVRRGYENQERRIAQIRRNLNMK